MRHNKGWVKINRGLSEHWVSGDLISLGLWTKLIKMANYKESKIVWKGKIITLQRGQLVTSLAELRGPTVCARNVIERLLNLMEADDMIVQDKGNEGRIITICNYSKYQDIEIDEGKRKGNEEETKGKHKGNEREHSKERNNYKKERKKELNTLYTPPDGVATVDGELVSSLSEEEARLGQEWFGFATKEMPWRKVDAKWNETVVATQLTQVKRIMNLNDEGIAKILDFVANDEFWRKNAISPKGLLKKNKDGIRKIETILTRLNTAKSREAQMLEEVGTYDN